MGHLLTSPLRSVASLAEAVAIASAEREADTAPPFAPLFFEASFGPIAVLRDGSVRQAELIADAVTGYTRVVVA